MSRTIEIKISANGEKVEIDVLGACGPECEGIVEKITKALGEVEKSDKKPEFYSKDKTQERTRVT